MRNTDESVMTAMFPCNVRKFEGSPHAVETPFGKPQIISIGNVFEERDALEDALRAIYLADGVGAKAIAARALGHEPTTR